MTSRESTRFQFIVQRDGLEEALSWVRQTIGIYRTAVFDKGHFASKREYKRKFIVGYKQFKVILRSLDNIPR